jgi:exodeoxyribonuclease III
MSLTIATWNINSVRLRADLVCRLLREEGPDVLCLQETKAPVEKLPLEPFAALGYTHVLARGEKGYNGVMILSRVPIEAAGHRGFCDRLDTRHLAGRLADGTVIHNVYVPAGGDLPDPAINPKFRHKLDFLAELHAWFDAERPRRAILVGDLNVAPLEHDVWSHRRLLDVVSHTPVETQALETLRGEAGWVDAARHLTPEPEKIYTWWSYRAPDWAAADKGRRLDHVWVSPDLAGTVRAVEVARGCRSWERPSDHVPVTGVMEL